MGIKPFNKKDVDDSAKIVEAHFAVLNTVFLDQTYLCGDRITAADIFLVSVLNQACTNVS